MEFIDFTEMAEYVFLVAGDVYKQYVLMYMLIGVLLFAAVYVLQSIGLYTIATKNGFNHKWMAFVPFVNTYYIGVLSEKNKIHGAKPKYFSLALAIVEAAYVILMILYYVATAIIFRGGYAVPVYESSIFGEPILDHYKVNNLPQNLAWAWWIFSNLENYVTDWLLLVYIVLDVFVLFSFFRTYSASRYLLFALLSVLFPIKGIFIFAVRNNRGVNFFEYTRELQRRKYHAYQESMRNNGGPYNQGGSYFGGNNPNGSYGGYPYGSPNGSAPEDPFGDFGAVGGNSGGGNGSGGGEDPFSDFDK